MDTLAEKATIQRSVPLNVHHARVWAFGSAVHWAAGAWGAWEAAVGRQGAAAVGTQGAWASQAAAALQTPRLLLSGPPK